MNEFERFQHGKRTIVLCYDDDASSPREYDNLTVLACWHRRQRLGDRQIEGQSQETFVESLESGGDKVLAILPIWIYQHSGITLHASADRPGYPFTCQWDSGQVGWAYVLESDAIKMGCVGSFTYNDKTVTYDKDFFLKAIESDVALYDKWLNGGFCGYIVEDEEGEKLESCWGFDDEDACREEAKSAAEHSTSPGETDSDAKRSCA